MAHADKSEAYMTRGSAAVMALAELTGEKAVDVNATVNALRAEYQTNFSGALQMFLAGWYAKNHPETDVR